MFFNFLNFLLFFSEFSSTGLVWTEFRTEIFFPSFSVYLILFWLKLMPKRGFLIFSIFYIFFQNFLPRAEDERNSRLNIFSLFLVLSRPVLAINNARKRFFNFWIFLQFFWNFLARVGYELNSGLKFFFPLFHCISSRFRWKYCREDVL